MANLGRLNLKATDPSGAGAWFERAAEAGHVDAMFEFAVLVEAGDREKAYYWYRRAAEAGHTGAMSNLGAWLLETNFEDNFAEARAWWERAAEAGDTTAMANLVAVLVEEDPDAARAWYERLAIAGDHGLLEALADERDSLGG